MIVSKCCLTGVNDWVKKISSRRKVLLCNLAHHKTLYVIVSILLAGQAKTRRGKAEMCLGGGGGGDTFKSNIRTSQSSFQQWLQVLLFLRLSFNVFWNCLMLFLYVHLSAGWFSYAFQISKDSVFYLVLLTGFTAKVALKCNTSKEK